jgi:hypothetical protein
LLTDITQGSREVGLGDIHIDLNMLFLNLGLQLLDFLREKQLDQSHPVWRSFNLIHLLKVTPLTSSCSFFKKAISSCKDSTLRSRSRRAREALSTSYFEKEKRTLRVLKSMVYLIYSFLINHMNLVALLLVALL